MAIGMDDYAANLVLSRLTYGPTPSARASLQSIGLDAWLSKELGGRVTENETVRLVEAAFPAATSTLADTLENPRYRRRAHWVSRELAALATIRRIFTNQQVIETLAEHFSDYLSVPLFGPADVFRMDYDRNIRAHINGTYPEMLSSAALHPAMLMSLNGQTNTAKSPNENFGRELLELFTVTPGADYSEFDVTQAALMMTGIKFNFAKGEVLATPSNHHFGPIRLLGFSSNNGPTQSSPAILARAREMIRHLALLPHTADAFALRMARRYVADVPSSNLVRAMSRTYLSTKGDILEVFRAMVLSPEFLSTKPSKLKRPSEHLASSIRALGLQLSRPLQDSLASREVSFTNFNFLTSLLERQGHLPFDWPTPDGFPDHAEAWTTFGGQAQRWNLSAKLSQGLMRSLFTQPTYDSLLTKPATAGKALDQVAGLILSSPLRTRDRERMIGLIESNLNPKQSLRLRSQSIGAMAFALVMATEEWNLR